MSNREPSDRPAASLRRPRASYGFRPRMAIGIVYLLVFFLLYGLLFVLPELLEILERVPPGPEQEALAKRAAHEALGSNVYTALAAAFVTVALGAYYRVLPGMKPAE